MRRARKVAHEQQTALVPDACHNRGGAPPVNGRSPGLVPAPGRAYTRAMKSGRWARASAGGHCLIYTNGTVMKVKNSLKSLRSRHRDNRVVRRKGRLYVINKTHRRFKARQG